MTEIEKRILESQTMADIDLAVSAASLVLDRQPTVENALIYAIALRARKRLRNTLEKIKGEG